MSSRSGSPLISRPRPGAAVAAAIVGIVVGAQILIGSITQFGYAVDNGMTWLLAAIALDGVLWLVGGIQMLGGRRTGLLIGSAVWRGGRGRCDPRGHGATHAAPRRSAR